MIYVNDYASFTSNSFSTYFVYATSVVVPLTSVQASLDRDRHHKVIAKID